MARRARGAARPAVRQGGAGQEVRRVVGLWPPVSVSKNLLALFDEADHGHGGLQEQPRGGGQAAEEVMAGIPEHGEGRVKYLVDTFERLLALAAAEGGPEARTKGRRTRTEEATPSARMSSPVPTRTPSPPADVSYQVSLLSICLVLNAR